MALIRTGTHYGSPLGSSLKNDLSGLRHLLSWDPFTGTESRSTSFVPRMNVVEREHGYTISADLPGVAEDDVEVTMHEGRLTIAGRQESEDRKEDETYVLYERSNGSFQRTFVLPDNADPESIEASLDSGVLTVNIAKRPEAKPRRIALARKNN